MTTPPIPPDHTDGAAGSAQSEPPTQPALQPASASPTPWWLPTAASAIPPDGASEAAPTWAPPPAPAAPDRSRLARAFARPRAKAGAVAAAALVVGAAAGAGVTAAALGGPADATTSGTSSLGNTAGSGTASGAGSSGELPRGTFPGPRGDWSGSESTPGTSSSVKASAAQQVGVVDIDTVDRYDGAKAAGTGLLITSSGEVLTNNHVVDGATKITVTVVPSGKSYTARVVGTSPTNDVAVLQLVGASGLRTAKLGDSSAVTVGESVTGVGNAGGTGGTPSAARGTVTALHKTISASSEDGSGAETLTGMIVTDAPIASGDSGGPLYDSADEVIGIDTAASSGVAASRGYAIPIDKALTIAHRIEAGRASATIHLGYPAFLGVALSQDSTRPVIRRVYGSSPAAKAGLAAGDTITAVNGTRVSSYPQLHKAIAAYAPGDRVRITFKDAEGASHTVAITLAAGPAD